MCCDGDAGDAPLLSFPVLDKEVDSCKAVGVELLILQANWSSFGVVSSL